MDFIIKDLILPLNKSIKVTPEHVQKGLEEFKKDLTERRSHAHKQLSERMNNIDKEADSLTDRFTDIVKTSQDHVTERDWLKPEDLKLLHIQKENLGIHKLAVDGYKEEPHRSPLAALIKIGAHLHEHPEINNYKDLISHDNIRTALNMHKKKNEDLFNSKENLHHTDLNEADVFNYINEHFSSRDELKQFFKDKLEHKYKLEHMLKTKYPESVTYDENNEARINLFRATSIPIEEQKKDLPLASYSTVPLTCFGSYMHKFSVPLKNIWYSYMHNDGNERHGYGSEKEFLVSPNKEDKHHKLESVTHASDKHFNVEHNPHFRKSVAQALRTLKGYDDLDGDLVGDYPSDVENGKLDPEVHKLFDEYRTTISDGETDVRNLVCSGSALSEGIKLLCNLPEENLKDHPYFNHYKQAKNDELTGKYFDELQATNRNELLADKLKQSVKPEVLKFMVDKLLPIQEILKTTSLYFNDSHTNSSLFDDEKYNFSEDISKTTHPIANHFSRKSDYNFLNHKDPAEAVRFVAHMKSYLSHDPENASLSAFKISKRSKLNTALNCPDASHSVIAKIEEVHSSPEFKEATQKNSTTKNTSTPGVSHDTLENKNFTDPNEDSQNASKMVKKIFNW